jgi:hypothetical protein
MPEPSEVSRVRIVTGKGLSAVEITSTHQVIPTVTRLDNPPHLIIDLPNAKLSVRRKRMEIHSGDINAVRLAHYPMSPPVVQVIVDLVKPHRYTWEAAGNRLIVRLEDEQQERGKEKRSRSRARQSPSPKLLTRQQFPQACPTLVRWFYWTDWHLEPSSQEGGYCGLAVEPWRNPCLSRHYSFCHPFPRPA